MQVFFDPVAKINSDRSCRNQYVDFQRTSIGQISTHNITNSNNPSFALSNDPRHFKLDPSPSHYYDYVLKTDDDCGVDFEKLKIILKERSNPHCWGFCPPELKLRKVVRFNTTKPQNLTWAVSLETYPHKDFPQYCVGLGYVLSAPLLHCVVPKLAGNKFQSNEDAATGILVDQCGGIPVGKTGDFVSLGGNKSAIISHKIW